MSARSNPKTAKKAAKHESILDFTKQQIVEALAFEKDNSGRAFWPSEGVRNDTPGRGEVDAAGNIQMPYPNYVNPRVTLTIGFEGLTRYESHFGFSIRLSGGGFATQPCWGEARERILAVLKEKLDLAIPPFAEAPIPLTEEELEGRTFDERQAAREEVERAIRRAEDRAAAKAKRAKRQKICDDAGIKIDLGATAKEEGGDAIDDGGTDKGADTNGDAPIDNEAECLADIESNLGFKPDEIDLALAGKFQYFGTYATAAGGAGWLLWHPDATRPWCQYGNLRGDGRKFVWKSRAKLTAKQKKEWETRRAAEALIAEKELEEAQAEGAKKAEKRWNELENNPPVDASKDYYLLKKKVGAYGLRYAYIDHGFGSGPVPTLTVPVRNIDDKIMSLEYFGAGFKDFMKGCAVKGGMHVIGPKITRNTEEVIICEGYATAAAVFELMEKPDTPVVVAFDAANMVEVAKILRARYPGLDITPAGDDDLFTLKTKGHNPGREGAENVADAVGGIPLFPPFDASELKGEKSDPNDWDDFMLLHGKEAAGACFMRMLCDKWDQQYDLPEHAAPEYSEADLAAQFDASYGGRVRYVNEWGMWLIYNGKRWREDKTNRLYDYVRKVCVREAENLDPTKSLARNICSAKCVAAVMKIAQALPRIAATSEQWDADPWLLNTPKGVVDLRTGAMREHRLEDYMTKCATVSPGGQCPRFLKFLGEVTNNDAEFIAYLRRKSGYSLTGVTTEHVVFFTFGPGANGKTVFSNTIGGIMGDYRKSAPITTFIVTSSEQHPTDLASLRGARLVTCSEVAKGQRWAEEKVKQMSGGDPITARFMRQDFFTYMPQFKLDILGNVRPSLRTVDEAAKRRFQMAPFNVVIKPEDRDHNLEKNLKEEWPGILRWMIEGCMEWQHGGLRPPPVVVDASDEYLRSQDITAQWLEDCCEINSPKAPTTKKMLFVSWKLWTTMAGEWTGTRNELVGRLRNAGFEECRGKAGEGFRGLRLTDYARAAAENAVNNKPKQEGPRPDFAGGAGGAGNAGNGGVGGAGNGSVGGHA
jgi:putative DNA primase/helicase